MESTVTPEIRELPVDLIYANPNQPRKVFDAAALAELSESIKESGLMQPVTVVLRKCDVGTYMVVAGERRLRATKLAGLLTIQAIVRELTDNMAAELALIENLLRKDLNDMEEARAYQAFLDRGFTLKQLSVKLGHSSTQRVADRLSLLNLDPSLQDGVNKGAIPFTQALEMSRLNTENQFALWRAIQDGRCASMGKLRRMAGALLDLENQVDLFATKPLTSKERKSLGKVDRFVGEAGRLLDMISGDDLKVVEGVLKSDAGACIDRLLLLAKTCYAVANSLQTSLAKQEAVLIQ